MTNFCTLFDSNYISKGIALYLSLEKTSSDFHLYVMAFDAVCYEKLKSIGFPNMTVELWDDWETPEIKAVKEDRTRAEYCWTCGPTVIYHFLTNNNLPDITYLDSDLFFIGNPKIAFDEIGSASVAITEQGISKEAASMYGKYCVQFMFFRNDKSGIEALKWWRDSCIDWCYMRFEGDKYADQKYLDQFPKKFDGVYVVKNPGVGVAPWNMYRYSYINSGKTIVKDKIEYPVVFFHMHGMKSVLENNTFVLQSLDVIINKKLLQYFFKDYADLLASVFRQYLNKKIEIVKVQGVSRWRVFDFYLRKKLNKIEFLRKVYYQVVGNKEYSSGTKI